MQLGHLTSKSLDGPHFADLLVRSRDKNCGPQNSDFADGHRFTSTRKGLMCRH